MAAIRFYESGFRVHGTNHQQRQPWYFGTTAEEVTKSAIQQRYSLIPYMYSYEREAYDSGLGLVYPLLFDYPDDETWLTTPMPGCLGSGCSLPLSQNVVNP